MDVGRGWLGLIFRVRLWTTGLAIQRVFLHPEEKTEKAFRRECRLSGRTCFG
ncbi:hypothetical protein AA3271_0900 [Gluconobacter japonicus NBRC 3271]|nr:hypothetical protein AA3271_0900 [Gluconobacter japonicus NBRC 3271]